MKNFAFTVAAMLISTAAMADGPGSPWDRPPVGHSGPSFSWQGVYGGVGVTTKKKTHEIREEIITEVEEPTGEYDRYCSLGTSGSTHSNNKCQLSKETWQHLRDTGQFPVLQSPWNKNGYKADGVAGDPVLYTSGYYGLWMNDNETLSFSSTDDGDAPTGANKPATEYLEGPITRIVTSVEEIFTLGEDEEITGNAFAGYRHVFSSGLAGGVEVGVIGGLEGQVGFSAGRTFAYLGYNSEEEVTLGADVLVGNGGLFVGGKVATGDDSRGELRVGWKF